MSTKNVNLTVRLKNELILKINEEWSEKWAENHGEDFDFLNLKSQNAFLDDLLLDIERVLKTRIGLERTSQILISRDSLRRIFNQKVPNSWQEKTRNTLSYYLGYEGWDDFEEKKSQLEELTFDNLSDEPKLSIPKRKKLGIIVSLILVLISVVALVYQLSKAKRPREVIFTLKTLSQKDFGATLKISYDLSKIRYKKAEVMILNEQFQPLNRKNKLELSLPKGAFSLYFFTPGLKNILLKIDGKVLKNYIYLVPTNGNWYGSARIKSKTVPVPFENGDSALWYGRSDFVNSEDYYVTSPSTWIDFRKKNAELNTVYFPTNEIKKENSFARVAYLKADDFSIDVDSLEIGFRAKRSTEAIGEDCLSFMMQLYDAEISLFEIYSASTCIVESNISLNKYSFPKQFHGETFLNQKLNDVLEDGEWHSFVFKMKHKKIEIYVDDLLIGKQDYKMDYKELKEIWFVFEGNGMVENVYTKALK